MSNDSAAPIIGEQFHESPGVHASQVAGTAIRSVLGAKFGVK